MSAPVLVTVLYPADPCGGKIGGIETFLRGFIKYAPPDFQIHWIGGTQDPGVALGKPMDCRVGERSICFTPLIRSAAVNRRGWIPLNLKFALRLRHSRRQLPASVLFCNRLEPLTFLSGVPFPKILVLHEDIPHQILAGKSELAWKHCPGLYQRFESRIMRQLQHVFAVSPSSLDYLYSRYPGGRPALHSLSTFYDPDIYYPGGGDRRALRRELAAQSGVAANCLDEPWLLFVGRLQPVKDPVKAIQVLAAFRKKTGQGHLLVAGAGNMEKVMRSRVATMGVAAHVTFTGIHSAQELADWYRAADVLLLTSHSEGMPLSVLEAHACGVPVVAPPVGRLPEIIQEGRTGRLALRGDVADYVACLESVLSGECAQRAGLCAASVQSFSPRQSLDPLYRRIRALGTVL